MASHEPATLAQPRSIGHPGCVTDDPVGVLPEVGHGVEVTRLERGVERGVRLVDGVDGIGHVSGRP